MIAVKGLTKSYGEFQVLKGIDFTLPKGGQCVIKGASGSGKSTFLHLLAGLGPIDSGTIEVNGLDLGQCSDEQLAQYRNLQVGLVFQFHFLLSSMKSIDNIYLPARIGPGVSKEIKKRVQELGGLLGVEHCFKKYPQELSGGEQQRINIIRACSLAPGLLLCDEPTGSLDSKNTQNVANVLKEISQSLKLSLVIVTHDQTVAKEFSQVLTIRDGRMFST